MIEPTQEDIIYAAGFFDGEGCVRISKSRNIKGSHHLVVAVSQKRPEVLYWLKERWAGSIYLGTGGKNLPYWTLVSRVAEKFLRDIGPYCHPKSFEINLALEYRENTFTLPDGSRSKERQRKRRLLTEEEVALREGYKLALQAAKRI